MGSKGSVAIDCILYRNRVRVRTGGQHYTDALRDSLAAMNLERPENDLGLSSDQ